MAMMNPTKNISITVLVLAVIVAGSLFFLRTYKNSAPSGRPPLVTDVPAGPGANFDREMARVRARGAFEVFTNEDLRDVYFCRSWYKTKQIIIRGVDIVQRISDIVETDPYKEHLVCGTLQNQLIIDAGLPIPTSDVLNVSLEGSGKYVVRISLSQNLERSFLLYINPITNEITTAENNFIGALNPSWYAERQLSQKTIYKDNLFGFWFKYPRVFSVFESEMSKTKGGIFLNPTYVEDQMYRPCTECDAPGWSNAAMLFMVRKDTSLDTLVKDYESYYREQSTISKIRVNGNDALSATFHSSFDGCTYRDIWIENKEKNYILEVSYSECSQYPDQLEEVLYSLHFD